MLPVPKSLAHHGHCPCCRSVALPASSRGEAQGILPSVDVVEGKDLFFNHGLVILRKRGVQEVGWQPQARRREQWGHCAAKRPGSCQKGPERSFQHVSIPLLRYNYTGEQRALQTCPLPLAQPRGAACMHTCRLLTGCKGTVTMRTGEGSPAGLVALGSAVGTNPGCTPSCPRSHGQAGGSSAIAMLLVAVLRAESEEQISPCLSVLVCCCCQCSYKPERV